MKRSNLIALSLLLGVGALSSCSNEDEVVRESVNNSPLGSFTATIEGQQANGLRSMLVDNGNSFKPTFVAGDVIAVTDITNTGNYSNSEANTSSFAFADGNAADASKTCYAFYPASGFESVDATGALKVNLPATQTYSADAIASEGAFPMMAMAEDPSKGFDFKNMDCLLKINVKTSSESETFSVKSIKLTTKSGAMSGAFTADYNSGNPTLTAVEGSSSNAVSLNCGDGVEINNEDKTFYIAIPAGTYDGLQVQVRLSNGYAYIDQPRDAKTFERSKFYTTSITVGATPTTGVKTCIDLGLSSGTLWATCNVGASSQTEYGDSFSWGETETRDDEGWSNYKWCNGNYDKLTKYCVFSDYGTVDGLTTLEAEDDAATVNWGSGWRMPTSVEIQELIDGCNWEWKSYNGVEGQVGTSKTNGETIFLPSSGIGAWGNCWASSSGGDFAAYCFSYNLEGITLGVSSRAYGASVRAVAN